MDPTIIARMIQACGDPFFRAVAGTRVFGKRWYMVVGE